MRIGMAIDNALWRPTSDKRNSLSQARASGMLIDPPKLWKWVGACGCPLGWGHQLRRCSLCVTPS